MSRLSSLPFAKSLLTVSLLSVFSTVSFASSAFSNTTNHFTVSINQQQQIAPHDSQTHPLIAESSWWGSLTNSQANSILIDVTEGQQATLEGDVLGGWAVNTGTVHDNQITIDESLGSIVLSGNSIYGGIAKEVQNSVVSNNTVSLEGVTVSSRTEIVAGYDFYRSLNEEEASNLSSTLTDNQVSIKNSLIDEEAWVGGAVQWIRGFDLSETSRNVIVVEDVQGSDGSKLNVIGVQVGDTIKANVSDNTIKLSNVFNNSNADVTLNGIYVMNGSENYIHRNHIELTNTRLGDGSLGIRVSSSSDQYQKAEVTNNHFIWRNNPELLMDLSQFMVIHTETGDSSVIANEVELEGITLAGNDSSEVYVFFSSASGKSVTNDNTLKVENSRFDNFYGVFNRFAGESKVIDNRFEIDQLKATDVSLIFSETENLDEEGKTEISQNFVSIQDSNLSKDLYGIDVLKANQVDIAGNEFRGESITVNDDSFLINVEKSDSSTIQNNTISIENSTVSDSLAGIRVSGDHSTLVSENVFTVDTLTTSRFRPMYVFESERIDINGNELSFNHLTFEDFKGITVSWDDDSSIRGQVAIADNKIVLKDSKRTAISFEGSDSAYDRVKFIDLEINGSATLEDNRFEFINVQDLDRVYGIALTNQGETDRLDIKDNTLLVKDSQVDEVIGIELDGFLPSDTQMNFNNNTIILDNVQVSGGVSSVSAFMTMRAGMSLDKTGKLVLQGHNSAESVSGFETFEFDLSTAENDTPMLTLTGTDTNTIKDQTLVLANGDQASIDDITLINTQDSSMSLSAENVVLQVRDMFTFKSLNVNAVFDEGGFQLIDYYEELMKQEDQVGIGALTLSDSQLATIALTRQSSEEALNLLQSTENLSTDAPMKGFATLSGSSNFYELGTGFDLNGTSLTVGGALRINDKWSGVGFANFSDANADSTVEGFRGDSDMKTYSAGVALRYQTEMPFYTEGAVVFGQADTDFVGSSTNDTARYNSDRFYTTVQLGVGTDFNLTGNVNLNLYGRYSMTYLDGDKVSLNNAYNDTFDVDDTMVHAMRVGARVKGSVAPNVLWFAGAAFERVLDGDVEAMVKDAKLKTETLKGNVGIFEVGATLAPNDLGPWTMDVKAGAYAGDRRGVSGSVNFNYVF